MTAIIAPQKPIKQAHTTVQVQQEAFKRALSTIMRAVPSKPVMPVLGSVLLRAQPGCLVLEATNLTWSLTMKIEATVDNIGVIAAPGKLLTDFVSTLPREAIEIEIDEGTQKISMRCGSCRATICGVDVDEYPTLGDVREQPTVTFQSAALSAAIQQVAIAVATTAVKPVLAGIHIKLEDTTAQFSACDRFSLAVKTVALAHPVAAPAEVIIAGEPLVELGRLLATTDAQEVTMTIAQHGSHVAFRTASAELITRVIDGTFPAVHRLIPTDWKTRAVVQRALFHQAVKQAQLFASYQANAVKLIFDLDAARLCLTANGGEIGTNRAEVDGTVNGDASHIALSVKFLAEALTSVVSTDVIIEMRTSQLPAVVRPVDDHSLVIVIMPMDIKEAA